MEPPLSRPRPLNGHRAIAVQWSVELLPFVADSVSARTRDAAQTAADMSGADRL